MSGLPELVAGSRQSGICPPLCSFCEENYNLKRKGGGEEHYILNSLGEIIAKSPSFAPCSPLPSWPLSLFLASWIWQRGDLQTLLWQMDGQLCRHFPVMCPFFVLTFLGQCTPTSAAVKGMCRRFCLGKDGVVRFSTVVSVIPVMLYFLYL